MLLALNLYLNLKYEIVLFEVKCQMLLFVTSQLLEISILKMLKC